MDPVGPQRPLLAVLVSGLTHSNMLDIRSWPIRGDRAIFIGGAVAVTALAWFYLVRLASVHSHHSIDFAATFLMWTVMMIAMMLPSALPFVFAFGAEHRKRRARNLSYVHAGVFLAGYFTMWTAFSAIAAWVQQALHRGALLSPMMTATSSVFPGAPGGQWFGRIGGAALAGAGTWMIASVSR